MEAATHNIHVIYFNFTIYIECLLATDPYLVDDCRMSKNLNRKKSKYSQKLKKFHS